MEGPPPSAAGPSHTKSPPLHADQTTNSNPGEQTSGAPANQLPQYYNYPAPWPQAPLASGSASSSNTSWPATLNPSGTYPYGAAYQQQYALQAQYQQQQYQQYYQHLHAQAQQPRPDGQPHPPIPFQQQQQQPYLQPYFQYPPASFAPQQQSRSPDTQAKTTQPTKRIPTPPPPPKLPQYWDAALYAFFTRVGLTQAKHGFEADMMVLNPEWEEKEVPLALQELHGNLTRLLKLEKTWSEEGNVEEKMQDDDGQEDGPSDARRDGGETDGQSERPLEERKLDYVQSTSGTQPRPQASVNKSISLLLARNRARNDASNRSEFLYPHPAKRRRIDPSSPAPTNVGSCARTDAKPIDRDVMMKYDIAKNEEGPLRRTTNVNTTGTSLSDVGMNRQGKAKAVIASVETTGQETVTAERHPGLDERLKNLETHLAVRYVPSPPVSLLYRLQYLEEHIMKLEQDHPPWAALHFNQPRRGWPPPPRPTPIIVPSHLTSALDSSLSSAQPSTSTSHMTQNSSNPNNASSSSAGQADSLSADGKYKKGKGRPKSSLHRAVMERLEVQKAMSDLKGAE